MTKTDDAPAPADQDALSRLIAAHPRLFRGAAPPISSFLPEGWYALTDRLCSQIENVLEEAARPEAGEADQVAAEQVFEGFEIRQIKEKFGDLRFYFSFRTGDQADASEDDLHIDVQSEGGAAHYVASAHAASREGERIPERFRALIGELIGQACTESGRTCEVCGAPGRRVVLQGYITALCIAHERQRQEQAHAEAQARIVDNGLRLESALLGDALDLGVEISRRQRVVTLHADAFEEQPIARFLVHQLPELAGLTLQAEPSGLATITDGGMDTVMSHAGRPEAPEARRPYALRLMLAGRPHPATLGLARDGRWVLRLGDPGAEDAQHRLRAIAQLLKALHEDHKIAALVTGIDDKGRPKTNDGMLELYAWLGNGASADDLQRQVAAMAEKVGKQHEVMFVFIANLSADRRANQVQFEPFFAWDGEGGELVRRNWLPDAIGVKVAR